jgi:hypothetical protein
MCSYCCPGLYCLSLLAPVGSFLSGDIQVLYSLSTHLALLSSVWKELAAALLQCSLMQIELLIL